RPAGGGRGASPAARRRPAAAGRGVHPGHLERLPGDHAAGPPGRGGGGGAGPDAQRRLRRPLARAQAPAPGAGRPARLSNSLPFFGERFPSAAHTGCCFNQPAGTVRSPWPPARDRGAWRPPVRAGRAVPARGPRASIWEGEPMGTTRAGWLVTVLVGLVAGAEPPAELTPQQRKELEDRSKALHERAGELSQRGQYAPATDLQ